MSSVTIILIILINNIYQIITIHQCNILSAIDLQSATYSHSLVLRVQPIDSFEEIEKNIITRKVLVREVIKIAIISEYQIKINDMIIIRIDKDLDEILDNSCWHLLRIPNVDIILFLNETNTNEFDLRHPPVESTFRVRQNIDAVINYETYSPQVIIKTQIDKPILSSNYSLQCNARGNPLPRLLWSKDNQILEYYSSGRQCKTSCRIYSIQNKYQSILYFQSLTNADSGIYLCHAENAINHTMISVYVDIIETHINLTCANLKFCYNRGQCIYVDNQLKCLCDNRYFGEHCEMNYDDIIKKQNNTILLFKSRFVAGCILIIICFILILITFISCLLTRNSTTKQKKTSSSKLIMNGNIPKSQLIEQINISEVQQSLSPPIVRIITKESSTATDDNNDKIDEEYSPLKINKTEELNFETKTNHLILSEGYLEFYQPDAESGLIRPLTIQTDTSKHYKKYVSFHNRFLVPRSVHQT